MRGRKITNIQWEDDSHFVCLLEYTRAGITYTESGYGWSKGGSFFMYRISNGHIEKLGSVRRHVVLDGEPEGV